jgi:exonuclease III
MLIDSTSTSKDTDFSIPLSSIDISCRQEINKEILDLDDTIDQMKLTDFYRVFHPTTAQYTFFSASHGTFFKIDHILVTKQVLTNKENWNSPLHTV